VATQVVCPSCRAAVDCSGGTAEVLEKRRKVAAIQTTLSLGAKAAIDDVPYTLIGLMQCADPDPEEPSEWVEYLLYSPRRGFLWLVESDEGWDRVGVCDRWPARITDNRYSYAGKPFDKLYDYESKVKVALGAFNWRVQAGDVTRITDYSQGNRKLTRETGAAELGWSVSGRVDAAQVQYWFNTSPSAAPAKPVKFKDPGQKSGGLHGFGILAIAAMVFLNIDSISDGHLLGPIIGLIFLWMPVWLHSLLRTETKSRPASKTRRKK
jgi:hypothetical protein